MANIRQIAVWKNRTEGEGLADFGWEVYKIGSVTDASSIEYTPSSDTSGNNVNSLLNKINNTINGLNDVYIKKSGLDTKTGRLNLQNSNRDIYTLQEYYNHVEGRIGQTAPSSAELWRPYCAYDKNNKLISYILGGRNTNNVTALTYGLRRHAASGTVSYTNYFQLAIDNSGNQSVSVSSPAAWRKAIDAQQTLKAGSNITISGNTISAKDTTYTLAGLGGAPKNHAVDANTYGLGTTGVYGHVKTINNLTQTSHLDGTALSAYQGKILNDKVTPLNSKFGYGNSGSQPVKTSKWTPLKTITFNSAGTYLVSASANFGNNKTGIRVLVIHVGTLKEDQNYGEQQSVNANGSTRLTTQRILTVNADETAKISVWHNGGADINVVATCQIIKLNNKLGNGLNASTGKIG